MLSEYDGKMLTRKKKEAIPAGRLNRFISEELNRAEKYIEKEICNKIDSMMKKGKAMYVNYQKKGETGKENNVDDADLDREAAEVAWPNFKTYYDRFLHHPALRSGSLQDSTITPTVAVQVKLAGKGKRLVVQGVPADFQMQRLRRMTKKKKKKHQ